MDKGIFILGTDTDVGKTVVSAGIMHHLLSNGHKACYFKPVSSGGRDVRGKLVSYDVSFVKYVAELQEADELVNPFRFAAPVSPHLASSLENRQISIGEILTAYRALKQKYVFLLAEGCGGLAVSLTVEGYMQHQLIKELGLECVLVAKTTLGTINHTLLTVMAAENLGIKIRGILFNGFSGSCLEEDNIKTIGKLAGLPVIGVIPKLEGINVENLAAGNLRDVFEKAKWIENLTS